MAVEAPVDWDLLTRFVVALGIGLLLGLERERHHGEKTVFAGVRTLPIVALSGVVLAVASQRLLSPWPLVVGVAVFGAFGVMMAWRGQHEGAQGFTTPVAFVATFLLGAAAGLGFLLEAVVAGVAIAFLLLSKESLHRFAEVLTEAEMRSALYFLVFAFILYPLAPVGTVDPWGLVHLRQVLLIVILVSLMSFLSFLAMRRFGPARGLPLTGLLGGLANSMAATAAVASLSLHSERLRRAAVQAILLAAAAMLARTVAIAAIVDPGLHLVRVLVVPLAVMGLALTVGVVAWRPRGGAGEEGAGKRVASLAIGSPFAIRPALRFGVVFLGLSVAAVLLRGLPALGDWGVYLTAVGGLVSAGAVVASMALLWVQGGLGEGEGALRLAASVCLAAVALSTAVKAAVARGAGREVARCVAGPVAASVAAGVAGAVLVRVL